jgi:hypothetical protein
MVHICADHGTNVSITFVAPLFSGVTHRRKHMAVQMHIYSAATFFGDFGLSATKIGVLAPSALKI